MRGGGGGALECLSFEIKSMIFETFMETCIVAYGTLASQNIND